MKYFLFASVLSLTALSQTLDGEGFTTLTLLEVTSSPESVVSVVPSSSAVEASPVPTSSVIVITSSAPNISPISLTSLLSSGSVTYLTISDSASETDTLSSVPYPTHNTSGTVLTSTKQLISSSGYNSTLRTPTPTPSISGHYSRTITSGHEPSGVTVTKPVTITETVSKCWNGSCSKETVTKTLSPITYTTTECANKVCSTVTAPCSVCTLHSGVSTFTTTVSETPVTIYSPFCTVVSPREGGATATPGHPQVSASAGASRTHVPQGGASREVVNCVMGLVAGFAVLLL